MSELRFHLWLLFRFLGEAQSSSTFPTLPLPSLSFHVTGNTRSTILLSCFYRLCLLLPHPEVLFGLAEL